MTDTTKKLWAALRKGDAGRVAAAAPTADLTATDKSGLTPLGYAALHGSTSSIDALLAAGAEADRRMDYGVTALSLAARHPAACRALSERADVNAATEVGTTALHRAAFWGALASVECLLARGADVSPRDRHGRDALSFAAERADGPVVRALLDAGAPPDTRGLAPVDSLLPFGAFYARSRPEVTPLALACRRDRDGVRALLLEGGADPDGVGEDELSPVMVAAGFGHVEAVEDLAARGADLTRVARGQREGRPGVTALFCALDAGHDRAAGRLLDLGAPPSSEGARSALHAAAESGSAAMVSRLLELGVDPDEEDEIDHPALERAAARGHRAVVEVLLEAGAEFDAARVRRDAQDHPDVLALLR